MTLSCTQMIAWEKQRAHLLARRAFSSMAAVRIGVMASGRELTELGATWGLSVAFSPTRDLNGCGTAST